MRRTSIDIHHHFFPTAYVEALSEQGFDTSELPEWSPEQSLEVMDRHGIERALLSVCSPAARKPAQASAINEAAARLAADHPDRFGAFATVPLPDVGAAVDEVARALEELELDGVILFSNVDGQYLGEPELDPVMQALDERSATVLVHANDRPGIESNDAFDAFVEYPMDIARAYGRLVANHVFDRFPRIRFIFANAGGVVPFLAERVGKLFYMKGNRPRWGRIIVDLIRKANGGLELAKRVSYDTADATSPHVLRALAALVEPSHVLFGSNFPWTAEPTVSRDIERLERFDAELDAADSDPATRAA